MRGRWAVGGLTKFLVPPVRRYFPFSVNLSPVCAPSDTSPTRKRGTANELPSLARRAGVEHAVTECHRRCAIRVRAIQVRNGDYCSIAHLAEHNSLRNGSRERIPQARNWSPSNETQVVLAVTSHADKIPRIDEICRILRIRWPTFHRYVRLLPSCRFPVVCSSVSPPPGLGMVRPRPGLFELTSTHPCRHTDARFRTINNFSGVSDLRGQGDAFRMGARLCIQRYAHRQLFPVVFVTWQCQRCALL